jgi:hypothetical protein
MRKSGFTEGQIIGMIEEQGAGVPTFEVCRGEGSSPATFYKLQGQVWRPWGIGGAAPAVVRRGKQQAQAAAGGKRAG